MPPNVSIQKSMDFYLMQLTCERVFLPFTLIKFKINTKNEEKIAIFLFD